MTDTITVLIVDDEPSARQTTEAQLSSEPYRLLMAENAVEAQEIIATEVPDLILLDVMIPGTDGFELCRKFRRNPRVQRTPIILITALDSRRDVVEGLEAGADDFLVKPVFGPELRLRVSNLINLRRYQELLSRQKAAALEELDKIRTQLLHMDRLATLGTFAAGVGHELNNIATVLITGSELLLEEVEAGEQPDTENIMALETASRHVADQGKAILRLGAPGSQDDAQIVSLNEVVNSVLYMLQLAGRSRHVSVCPELCSDPLEVRWNRTQLEQVIINICANATDAMREGQGTRLEVTTTHNGGQVQLVVRDDGPGIPADVLPRINEPFYTTKAPGKGTGLGIPVVRRLIEDHDAQLHISSEVGVGTTVTVTLQSLQAREQ